MALEVQIGADNSELNKKIKEAELALKELSQVKLDRIKLGLDTKEIDGNIKSVKKSLIELKTVSKDTGNAIGGMTPKIASGSNALMQFSRIAQDAPYGIIGIGNNITATAESFGYLVKETGSAGGALKAVLSSLSGVGGILLGVSLLTTGLTLLSQSGLSVGDVLNKLTGDFDALGEEIQKVSEEAAKNSGAEIANMKALVSVAQDEKKTRKDRLIAVQELQKEFPGYFGNLDKEKILNGDVSGTVKELTAALIARAKAIAFSGKLGELASQELVLNAKLVKAKKELIKQERETNLLKQQSNSLQGQAANASFQSAGASADSARGIKDDLTNIRNQLANNKKAQDTYTAAINATTSASIKLKETIAPAGKKEAFSKDTPQVLGVNTIPLNLQLAPINTEPITTSFKGIRDVISSELDETMILLAEFSAEVDSLVVGSLQNTFSNLGTSIGEALATGGNVLQAIGKTLLQSLGSFLSDMGGLLIKYGTLAVVKGKLDLAILTGGPVAIGAGLAAIAVGVALKAAGGAIGKAAQSGGSSGGSRSTGADYNSPASSSSGGFSGGSGYGTVVFEISGQSLIGVLSRTLDKNTRLGGVNAV